MTLCLFYIVKKLPAKKKQGKELRKNVATCLASSVRMVERFVEMVNVLASASVKDWVYGEDAITNEDEQAINEQDFAVEAMLASVDFDEEALKEEDDEEVNLQQESASHNDVPEALYFYDSEAIKRNLSVGEMREWASNHANDERFIKEAIRVLQISKIRPARLQLP